MRRWLKRAALAVLALVAAWLLAVNLALNTPPLASALNRRPERFRIEWRSAWCVVPGRVHLRGLRLESRATRTGWAMEADRVAGHIDLRALWERTLRVPELRGEGVRSEIFAHRQEAKPRTAPPAGGPRRPPWRYVFERIELRHVRQLRFAGLHLTGDGNAAATLRVTPGREVRLQGGRLEMAGAQLRRGARVLVSELALLAEADLGPYAPRQHPGLGGWDFVTGGLTAQGRVDDLPLLDRVTAAGPRSAGALAARLRVERGRLLPGSTLRLTAPSTNPASTLVVVAAVEGGPPAPILRLGLQGRGIAGGRGAGRPPVLQIASLTLDTTTAETRMARLVAAARARKRAQAAGDILPLLADALAEGVRIDAPSSRLVAHAVLDRLTSRVDLGALLAREVAVEGLEVSGAGVRFDLATAPSRAATPGEPWAVRIDGARVTGLREVAIGDIAFVGAADAAGSLSLDRAGTLHVPRATLAMPVGRVDVGGAPAASGLAVELEAAVEPVRSGPNRRGELLRATSGRGKLSGSVASLGFLQPYLERTPWLGLQGQGAFTAELAVDHGRFATGSRLALRGDPVVATLFASQASGRGTVEIAVEPGPAQPRTALRVRFERFGLADRRRPRQAPYLRGSGLRITAIAPEAVDLADPLQDFEATLDLADAEVPDLAVYDRLLPAGGGLTLLGGRGRARLHLQASTATRKATGNASVVADDARFRFQNLELRGRLAMRAPLVTPDLMSNRFDLAGTRLDLDGIATRDVEGGTAAQAGWWAHAQLAKGSLLWGDPLSLRGEARVTMRDSGPLLALFAHKSVLVRWFDDALRVEDVTAQAVVRLDKDLVAIDSLHATAGTADLEVRSRMRFSKGTKRGDLYLRYGRLAAGVELRDGRRDLKLRKALEWYNAAAGRPLQ